MKFKDMKMTDSKSINVLIFLEDSIKPIGGTLLYDNNNITLSYVIDEFGFKKLDQKQSIEYLRVLTHEGEYITLINGYILNYKIHTSNISTYEWHFQYLIVAKGNYEVYPEIKEFTGFKINCTYLKEILKNSPFTIGFKDVNEFPSYIETNLNIKMGFSIIKNPQIQVTDFISAKSTIFDKSTDLLLESTSFINIKFFKYLNLEEIIVEVNNFKNLLSFLMDMRILVEELYIKNDKGELKVLWSNESNIKVSQERTELIENASDLIQSKFPIIVTNFYKTDIFKDIFETFVNNMYKPIYVDDYLLSQIKLIEGLDTRFRDKNQRPLKHRVKKFFELFNEREVESINKKLNNEITLNQDLIDFLHNFRNYHSHLYEIERKPYYDTDMYVLSKFLRELVKTFMINKLTDESLLKSI